MWPDRGDLTGARDYVHDLAKIAWQKAHSFPRGHGDPDPCTCLAAETEGCRKGKARVPPGPLSGHCPSGSLWVVVLPPGETRYLCRLRPGGDERKRTLRTASKLLEAAKPEAPPVAPSHEGAFSFPRFAKNFGRHRPACLRFTLASGFPESCPRIRHF